jgi:hypothetical protein
MTVLRTYDLRASKARATVTAMHDPIPILMARERVRAGIERPGRERRRGARRRAVAAALRTLADRVDVRPVPDCLPGPR